MKKDIGLVLCGGGGRGAYQIGVWKALNQLGYTNKIAAISGTSVGALNAALIVSKEQNQMEDIWCSIQRSDFMDMKEIENIVGEYSMLQPGKIIQSLASNVIGEKGIFSRDGFRKIIESNNICEGVLKSDIPLYACYKQAESGKIIYKDMTKCETEEEVTEVLFATSSVPVIFKMQKHDNSYNLDGGFYGNNTPITPLYDMGLRKFIVVSINPKKSYFFEIEYNDSAFILIQATESIYLGDWGENLLNDGMIDFNGDNAKRRIELGYQEALYKLTDGRAGCPEKIAKKSWREAGLFQLLNKYLSNEVKEND